MQEKEHKSLRDSHYFKSNILWWLNLCLSAREKKRATSAVSQTSSTGRKADPKTTDRKQHSAWTGNANLRGEVNPGNYPGKPPTDMLLSNTFTGRPGKLLSSFPDAAQLYIHTFSAESPPPTITTKSVSSVTRSFSLHG